MIVNLTICPFWNRSQIWPQVVVASEMKSCGFLESQAYVGFPIRTILMGTERCKCWFHIPSLNRDRRLWTVGGGSFSASPMIIHLCPCFLECFFSTKLGCDQLHIICTNVFGTKKPFFSPANPLLLFPGRTTSMSQQ